MAKRFRTTALLAVVLLVPVLLPMPSVSAQTGSAESMEEANRLYNEGSELRMAGRYVEALEKLGEAARIYLSLQAAREAQVTFYWVGECLVNLGHYQMALDSYSLSLSLAETVGSAEEKALTLNMIGICHVNLGNYGEALANYQAALEIRTELGDREGMALLHGNIGAAHNDADRLEDALVHYLKAVGLYEQLADHERVASHLHDAGLMHELLGRYQEASDCYERALEINARLGLREREALMLYKAGTMQKHLGRFDRARGFLQRALATHRELGDADGIPATMLLLGEIEEELGNYREALGIYEQVLAMDRRSAHPLDLAATLNHVAGVYQAWGRYDQALACYRESLEITRSQNDHEGTAANLGNIGDVYRSWGSYDEALEFYSRALALNREHDRQEGIGSVLANMGNLYSLMGRWEEAFDSMERALSLFEGMGDRARAATLLNNLGQLYNSIGNFDQAVRYFENALERNEELGLKENTAAVLNNIGSVHSLGRGDDEEAVAYFRRALEIFEGLGSRERVAGVLNNIGVSYGNLKRYDGAVDCLNRAVELKEELRLTAEGVVRRDYLASQLYTYQILTSVHVKAGRPLEAFDTVELASSKYLVEQMRDKPGAPEARFTGLEAFRRGLPPERAVINYANVDFPAMVQIVAGRDRLASLEVRKDAFLEKVMEKHGRRIRRAVDGLRGFRPDPEEAEEDDREAFDNAVTYYRQLLAQPRLNRMERAAMQFIGRALYDLLILPLEPHLEGKRELLILPDGILAFLPFEALIAPDGRYLVERYHVRYSQSLTVTGLIEERRYPADREPMLAVGGAVYDAPRYEEQMVGNERELRYLVKETIETLESGGSARGAYAALGVDRWANLPGTLVEVDSISRILPDARVLTGMEASEGRIKELSARGDLRDFQVLHFATHGLVVPEIPELSAVVLSLAEDQGPEGRGQDGYLTMGEIAALDIHADFVNLSACETGLGKIYGGEGVVGLIQSFLVAGANGLSVSLWQVSDESTMRFMTGLYRLVQEEGLPYHRALTEMKRSFLEQADLRHPFYWAPFVYYGR